MLHKSYSKSTVQRKMFYALEIYYLRCYSHIPYTWDSCVSQVIACKTQFPSLFKDIKFKLYNLVACKIFSRIFQKLLAGTRVYIFYISLFLSHSSVFCLVCLFPRFSLWKGLVFHHFRHFSNLGIWYFEPGGKLRSNSGPHRELKSRVYVVW